MRFVKNPEEAADVDGRMFATVTPMLDSGRTRVVAYLMVAALAAVWYVRERRAAERHDTDWWPTYWLLTALVLISMGVGRVGSLGDAVAEIGREQARSSGWYERRRDIQAIAIIIISIGWFLGVLLAIWRFPPRRRRYLPSVITITALAAFAGVRVISLHQVDTVLYRRDVVGIRIVSITELALLAAAATTILVVRGFASTADSLDAPLRSDHGHGPDRGMFTLPAPERSVGHRWEDP